MSTVEEDGKANGAVEGQLQQQQHEQQQQRKEEHQHANCAAAAAASATASSDADWVVLAQDYMSDTTSKVCAPLPLALFWMAR